MYKICFVCLGNICRSPMAEYMMKDRLFKKGLEDSYMVASRGTSYEESGNDMYPPAKKMLFEKGISFKKHVATRLEKDDYNKYDVFYCMEGRNVSAAIEIFGDDPDNKVHTLLDRNIADPWYTGDFLKTYNDLLEGIDLLFNNINENC